MAKTKISEYSATANSNTDVASINIDEGCAPSGINNAIRAVMGHLKDFQQGTNGDPFNGPVNGTLGATTASTANVTTLTTSSTVTHNGGTAYGVGYLNASKVLTTGSALVFDGSNLGLGVTPSASNASKSLEMPNGSTLFARSAAPQFGLMVNAVGNWYEATYKTTAAANMYLLAGGQHQWYNAPSGTAGNTISFTQAMTLEASGNLLVGTTSTGTTNTTSLTLEKANGYMVVNHVNGTSTGAGYAIFGYNGTLIGSITQNGTTAVAYNTSSDYRLKNSIAPMTGALAKVALLKPCTYKWNADGSDGEGFIAHELAEVVPQCVTGEKDAVDAEGKPQYQGIDTSFLVATLTAAIQELKAEFDAYKASHP